MHASVSTIHERPLAHVEHGSIFACLLACLLALFFCFVVFVAGEQCFCVWLGGLCWQAFLRSSCENHPGVAPPSLSTVSSDIGDLVQRVQDLYLCAAKSYQIFQSTNYYDSCSHYLDQPAWKSRVSHRQVAWFLSTCSRVWPIHWECSGSLCDHLLPPPRLLSPKKGINLAKKKKKIILYLPTYF